jgi:hypothetical protein
MVGMLTGYTDKIDRPWFANPRSVRNVTETK